MLLRLQHLRTECRFSTVIDHLKFVWREVAESGRVSAKVPIGAATWAI